MRFIIHSFAKMSKKEVENNTIKKGLSLTWSESDVDVLHRVAIDLHNSLTSAKTGFKTNLTAQKAITEELAEKKENFDMILEELKKRYANVQSAKLK